MDRVSILIVDDSFVIRRGLRSFLETEPGFVVAGDVSNGAAAVQFIRENDADIILMDVRMPGISGIAAASEILTLKPGVKILILSVTDDPSTMLQALLAGARGYLVYGYFNPEELTGNLQLVMEGNIVTVPPLSSSLADSIRRHVEESSDFNERDTTEALTGRETEILGLIALGKGNRDIAETLHIEEKTVKNHISNLYSKLQIKSRYEAISYLLNTTRRTD